MPKAPYVGITDFIDGEQAVRMKRAFDAHRKPGSDRRLHIGVMMSRKTMLGEPTKWAKAFPPKEKVTDIFCLDGDDVMNCLHYADSEHDPELGKHLCQAIGYGGIGIDAVQLDLVWPEPNEVWKGLHTSRKHLYAILQVRSEALELVNDDPDGLVGMLTEYADTVTHVLLDKSAGSGKTMNAQELLPFVRAIRERLPHLGVVVAGGLGPDTLHLLDPIVAEFPDVSIDAQGRLRPTHNSLDPVDWDMAEAYLTRALGKLS